LDFSETILSILLILSKNKKAMRGKNAWLRQPPVRHGPPFGGITRIRFKGFVYDVSAIRLPRINLFQTKTDFSEVNRR
jgi:hypothetical protein